MSEKIFEQREIANKITDKIVELRKKHGLTQRQFAEILGVRLSKLQDIERKKQKCTYDILVRIAKKFGINLHLLITGEYPPDPHEIVFPKHWQYPLLVEQWIKNYWIKSSFEEKLKFKILFEKNFPEFVKFLEEIEKEENENSS